MARKAPYIPIGNTTLVKDRTEFNQFVLNVIKDTFIYDVVPSLIELDSETNTLFTLYLFDKKIIIDGLEVDEYSDYVDVYLFGIKQPQDRYSAEVVENNIIVTFVADITRLPNEVSAANFEIKGKIVEIV
jgi:hypothetical protein